MESSRSQVAKTKAEFDGEALIKAVEVGNINEVTKLLRKGANINYVHRRILSNGNQFALTPLAAAAKQAMPRWRSF